MTAQYRFMITQRIFSYNLIIRKNIKILLTSKYDPSINFVSKPEKKRILYFFNLLYLALTVSSLPRNSTYLLPSMRPKFASFK